MKKSGANGKNSVFPGQANAERRCGMEQNLQNRGKGSNEKTDSCKKPRTKPEKQWGMTPKEGADDDNPAM